MLGLRSQLMEPVWGGLPYCNNQTFNPDYCFDGEVHYYSCCGKENTFCTQISEMKYLVYFQAYTTSRIKLRAKRKYEEALKVDGVVGLVIVRLDCMPEALLHYSRNRMLCFPHGRICKYLWNFCNVSTVAYVCVETVEAVERTAACGILTEWAYYSWTSGRNA